jgi:hypothetical protein
VQRDHRLVQKRSKQYYIPPVQRPEIWTKPQCFFF